MRANYFRDDEESVSEDNIVSDEAAEHDEWEDMPTTPRFRHSNIGENNQD